MQKKKYLQGTDNLPEFTIGGIKTKRYQTNEPYSALQTVIQLRHLYTTQVSIGTSIKIKVALEYNYSETAHLKNTLNYKTVQIYPNVEMYLTSQQMLC